MATYNPNTTTAELGNQNKAVADLQTQLNAKGANLKVDSKYGPLTQAAAAKYGVTVPSDVITSDKLVPTKPLNLPDAKPATFGGVDGAIDGLVQQQKVVDETPAQNEYLKALKESGYISSSVDRSAQDAAKKQSDLYTSQIEQEQLSNRRQIERLQKNMEGALASGISIESERLTRDSLSKQADLAILQTAANRNYDTAASIADRQVAMKMEQSRANLEALKMLDQREYGEITARKEREFKKQEDAEKQISQLKLNVAQYGGGVGLLNQLSAIDTTKPGAFDQAIKIAGKYASDPLDRDIKKAQLSKLRAESGSGGGSNKLLSVAEATAAGVPYGTTEAQLIAMGKSGGTFDLKKSQDSLTQIAFLSKTAKDAQDLSKGAGKSGISKFLGNTFVGDTKRNQLLGLSDTLKTNILTMASDPAIKKFFGPQMSEADVRMMTASGTTLNPDTQTPEQFKAEAIRVQNLFDRAKKAVEDGIREEQRNSYIDATGTALQSTNSPFIKYP